MKIVLRFLERFFGITKRGVRGSAMSELETFIRRVCECFARIQGQVQEPAETPVLVGVEISPPGSLVRKTFI